MDFFWRIFEQSGSIEAYLSYKARQKSRENPETDGRSYAGRKAGGAGAAGAGSGREQ